MEYIEQLRHEFRTGAPQLNINWIQAKNVGLQVVDTLLRLPGLILLELWWRNRDMTFEEISQEMLNKAPFNSYMDISTILDFVHRRNLDQSASYVLSYSVLLLSAMMLTLPIQRLLRMYCHALSLVVLAVAQYMSTIYVRLEQESPEEELQLDDFVKLERHGFHFLTQGVLAMISSFLLGLDNLASRLLLTPFTIPIIARMCACPQEKLIVAHNIACSLAMIAACVYMLHKAPSIAQYCRNALTQLKAILVVNGLALGAVIVWRRLRIAELLTCAWLTFFHIRLYVELYEKGRPMREAGPAVLASIAEATNTPLSLMALGLTVSFVSKWIVSGAQLIVGGTRDHGHVLAHSGYTESLTLVFLCMQTGLLGMKKEQKEFLLGLVFFVVISALLQSLYELVEPQLLTLAATPSSSRGRHMRCIVVAGCLMVAPVAATASIIKFLPLDIWCIIVASNCFLTAIHSACTVFVYSVAVVEARAAEPWERSDDLIYNARAACKFVELLIALAVLVYGVGTILTGNWTASSLAILFIHFVLNVYKRIEAMIVSIRSRKAALRNLDLLPRASAEQLQRRRGDVCAICFTEMVVEARVTPCTHFFHGACLRKWLSVKQVCPLCYTEIKPALEPMEAVDRPNEVEPHADPIGAARDMWPLAQNAGYESGFDSDEAEDSEYTLGSSDESHEE